ncbi:hypothetical protein BU14_0183s0015 [Porphyra umbilicalis]|uniref:Uncharacterized protein n=1 Tax=Porphyra umbilicalis TaxID=2786 RepID=A0A1X6P6V3_PORUM|nr:hypothetical protein BU14_0183s0015 [Porphyra umbilicalis]|eukprot:OSX76621.1 hypothetical protein BU14_0183s0015 [Porphyra umbilicalis]
MRAAFVRSCGGATPTLLAAGWNSMSPHVRSALWLLAPTAADAARAARVSAVWFAPTPHSTHAPARHPPRHKGTHRHFPPGHPPDAHPVVPVPAASASGGGLAVPTRATRSQRVPPGVGAGHCPPAPCGSRADVAPPPRADPPPAHEPPPPTDDAQRRTAALPTMAAAAARRADIGWPPPTPQTDRRAAVVADAASAQSLLPPTNHTPTSYTVRPTAPLPPPPAPTARPSLLHVHNPGHPKAVILQRRRFGEQLLIGRKRHRHVRA